MFDYYKAWDKFAADEEKKNDDGHDFIEAKNPIPEEEKPP